VSAGESPRFEVRIDEILLAEDLTRCTQAARTAIEPMVASLQDVGIPVKWLRRCEGEGRDGTRLKGCVKVYIPQPAGRWGAVLAADEEASKPALVLLAVGERHPDRPWRPSVYEIAHRRYNR
jgi:hypothetical protein